jgi:hypothetical protein
MVTMATSKTTHFVLVFEEVNTDCAVVACCSEEVVGDR